MANHVAATKHTHPNGDVTWTNMYDGSTQHWTKQEYEENARMSDKEREKKIEGDFKGKKGR